MIAKIVHAVENVHTFETSKDWDEENGMEDDKEKVNNLYKEEENLEHNKEDTGERISLMEETLVNEMKGEETFSKEREVNHLKEKQEKRGHNCMISDAAKLHCTQYIICLLARGISVLLCQPIGKQTEVVLPAVLR